MVSRSIVLSLGLVEPPDQMGAKFYYVRFLSVVSKCVYIPTLVGTTSKFPKLQVRNQKSRKSKKNQGTEKIPSVVGLLFKDLNALDVFAMLMFWTVCLVCMQQLPSSEPSKVQF